MTFPQGTTASNHPDKQTTPERYNPTQIFVAVGAVSGLLGGLFSGLTVTFDSGFWVHLLVCILLGMAFGFTFRNRLATGGEALIWGQSLGLMWWLFGTTTLLPLAFGEELKWTVNSLSALFPDLLGWVFSFGAVAGTIYRGLLAWSVGSLGLEVTLEKTESHKGSGSHHLHILLISGFSGLVGSWLFALGIDRGDFYPLIANLMGTESMLVGSLLHYVIGMVIGVSFGYFFHNNLRGAGVSMIWGVNYGIVWWVLGPLTLMPLLGNGTFPEWTLSAAKSVFPSFISHIIYGAFIGYFCGLLDQLWRVLFVNSDPLNRIYEGAGAQGVRNLMAGAAGGVVGGFLFSILLAQLNALPGVARVIGSESVVVGFLIHFLISIVIGISYGFLFQKHSISYGSGLVWGMLYGFIWWILGSLTLFAILFRQQPDWSLSFVISQYPSLIGHLLYGAGLGLFFQYLSDRYGPVPYQVRYQNREIPPPVFVRQRQIGTPAPALWSVTLLLGVILPLILGLTE